MQNSSVMMSDLSWSEYERRLKEEDAIVFLAIGALEQHGHHLPLGTDWQMGTYMAKRVAEAVGGVVAPTVTYAARSQVRTGGGPHRMGGINLRPETLINTIYDILMELARHGARKIALVDAHFENRFLLDEACYRAQQDLEVRGVDDITIIKVLYPERISPETMAKVYEGKEYPGLDLEHGAILETSMMLCCHPELVHMERITDDPAADFPPYDVYPIRPEWVPESGCLARPHGSNAEIGQLLVDEFVENLINIARKEFRGGK